MDMLNQPDYDEEELIRQAIEASMKESLGSNYIEPPHQNAIDGGDLRAGAVVQRRSALIQQDAAQVRDKHVEQEMLEMEEMQFSGARNLRL